MLIGNVARCTSAVLSYSVVQQQNKTWFFYVCLVYTVSTNTGVALQYRLRSESVHFMIPSNTRGCRDDDSDRFFPRKNPEAAPGVLGRTRLGGGECMPAVAEALRSGHARAGWMDQERTMMY